MAFLNETGLARVLNGLKNVFARVNHGNHVPATETANNAKFLRNDNSWQLVTPAHIGAAGEDSLTAEFSQSVSYLEGAHCWHEGVFYKAKNNVTAGSAFNSSDWEVAELATELEDLSDAFVAHNHDSRYYTESEVDTFVSGLNARIDQLDPEQGVGIFTDVTVTIQAASWTEDSVNHAWTYVYQNPVITQRSGVEVFYNQSYRTALQGDIYAEKSTGYVTFTTNKAPVTGQTLTCTLRVIDSIQGVVPVDHGGTGATTAAAARANLAINAENIPMSSTNATSVSQAIADLLLCHYEAEDKSLVFRSSEVAAYDETDKSIAINI